VAMIVPATYSRHLELVLLVLGALAPEMVSISSSADQ